MTNRKLYLALGILAVFLMAGLPRVQAAARQDEVRERLVQQKAELEQQRDELREQIEQQKDRVEEQKSEIREEACMRIQERIVNSATDFDANRARHAAAYQNLLTRLNSMIRDLADRDLNTAALVQYAAGLEDRIASFVSNTSTYREALTEMRQLACGHAEADFRGKLLTTRQTLQTVRADALEIHGYYQNTIRPELMNLRSQLLDRSEARSGDSTSTSSVTSETTVNGTTTRTVTNTTVVNGEVQTETNTTTEP